MEASGEASTRKCRLQFDISLLALLEQYVKVAKTHSGAMELGGNMPGSLEARFAEAEKLKQLNSGELSHEDFDFAVPAGDTREAKQLAGTESQTAKPLKSK